MSANHADVVAKVREGYDRWSEVYDHDANPLTALEEPFVRRAVGDVEGLQVLDLGCGTGRHSAWLAAAGAKVTAADFSPGMLDQAREKTRKHAVEYLVHDLHEPLPVDGGQFDLVVSGLVLEHLRDLSAVFVEVRRLLRPGARAVLSTMHPAMFLRGSQARFTDPDSGKVIQPGSLNHSLGDFVMAILGSGLSLDGLSEICADADFAVRYPRAEKYIDWPMLAVFEVLSPV